jgi:hypothetical protein
MKKINNFFTRVKNHKPIDDADGAKNKFVSSYAAGFVQQICLGIDENIPKQNFIHEPEMTIWVKPIKTYWRLFIDLLGDTHVGDIKSIQGSVKKQVIKTDTKNKKRKTTTKIIDGYSYVKRAVPKRPFFSDLMQISLYAHATEKKPFLIYANHYEYAVFTEENCEQLKPENRKKYLNHLITLQKTWELKLEKANDINELALLCKPDFSDIEKGDWFWKSIPDEYIKRLKDVYNVH